MKTPLASIRFTEPVQACGLNEIVYLDNSQDPKKRGMKITDIGTGIALEREGFPTGFVYYTVCKNGIALENISAREGQHEMAPEEQAKVTEAKKLNLDKAPKKGVLNSFTKPAKKKTKKKS